MPKRIRVYLFSLSRNWWQNACTQVIISIY